MAVHYKDYYESLGVPRNASDADIKKAFLKLAREFHPDVAKEKKKAEERFKEINEAYEVLSDPAKRKKYDQLGADWKSGAEFRPPPGWANCARGSGGAAGFEEDLAERGRDIEGDIMVTLDEAKRGSVRSVSVRHNSHTDTYQVKIPAGVTEGQRLRVAGRGEAGAGGGSAGDLYLRVRLARQPALELKS